MYCLFCDVPCIVCVYMCTEILSPGSYPIAVKYIIPYLIISNTDVFVTEAEVYFMTPEHFTNLKR